MRRAVFLGALSVLAVFHLGYVGASAKEKTQPRWGPFTAYSGARRLCQEHVLGKNLEISWQTYATVDPIAQVVAFLKLELIPVTIVG